MAKTPTAGYADKAAEAEAARRKQMRPATHMWISRPVPGRDDIFLPVEHSCLGLSSAPAEVDASG